MNISANIFSNCLSPTEVTGLYYVVSDNTGAAGNVVVLLQICIVLIKSHSNKTKQTILQWSH